MLRDYFKKLEQNTADDPPLELDQLVDQLAYNEAGLIPVITQDARSKTVLMLAWMNKQALLLSISTQRMTYWSRSRQQLWEKGATSGHVQSLVSMSFDCDGDAILCQVNQLGAACHTGRADCFYLKVDVDKKQVFIDSQANKIAYSVEK
ncbi:MAG: phosphoribosyl-AMP cyclohydrolase [Gammaproteobacteria bacterium]|nr:phosphoribosyl-AMP cyclohydrolase [Gammaproteobacteria bacterium]